MGNNIEFNPEKSWELWDFSVNTLYIDITKQNSTCGHIIFMNKSYHDIVDIIVFISSKTGQK